MRRRRTWSALLVSRIANRRFVFTLACLAVCGAKGAHLHNHRASVAPKRMLLFFFSFFTQDVLFLLLLRLLLDHWLVSRPGYLRRLVTTLTFGLVSYNVPVSIFSISFYLVAGSEIHWRNIGFVTDPAALPVLVSGLMTLAGVVCFFIFLSAVLQDACYGLFGWGADIVQWPITFTGRRTLSLIGLRCEDKGKTRQSYDEHDRDATWSSMDDDGHTMLLDGEKDRGKSAVTPRFLESPTRRQSTARCARLCAALPYIVVSILLTALFTLTSLRPRDPSLLFLSWTSGLLPFVDFASTSPMLDKLPSHFGSGIQHDWDNRTALVRPPPPFDWLPKDIPVAGFEDWHANQSHYSAAADPMRVSNLEEPLLQALRDKLQDVSIRHILVFILESTRHDVFPIKKDGLLWKRFADTFPDGQLPWGAQQRLATLTPTANYITGDYDDGFIHNHESKRGGIRFTNAHTAGTYTLKSMVGTVCGVAPLVGDFNVEYSHHIYQPCLPHVLEAMNQVERMQSQLEDIHQVPSWKSYHFQAATADYDNQMKLMSAMGFPEEHIIDREYLRRASARHGPVKLPNINEFAFEEDPLEDYIRDIFVDAQKTDSRVFLTHLTSTSHHRFHMPARERYVPMARGLEMMSRYVNTEGYDDKWIHKVLDVLDDQGVANETLVLFLGDHGVSLPENDIASPYYNPNIGVDHIPLVISHPALPPFDVHDAVHSSQVLPTIIDLLVETGSLTDASRQAASDLMRNYEGQSLIRPLRSFDENINKAYWQFTVTSPGRAMLTLRDARFPERRLVVPIIENVAWRLTDLTSDPEERHSIQSFDFLAFLERVERRHGHEWAEWVEEGAFLARWFVKENSKRWRFDHSG